MKNQRAFTLIEILVVIAIIALVIGIFLPNYNDIRKKSRDNARKAGIKAVIEALELYKLNQSPPSYLSTAAFAALVQSEGAPWTDGGVTYMQRFPVDPLYNTDPNEFFYRYGLDSTNSLKYVIGVCLEDAADPEGYPRPTYEPFLTVLSGDCTSGKWYYKSAP